MLDHVAGYTCANDVGMHDFRHADRGSMLRVKGQDGFLPLGPELVPAYEFDPTSFTLRTWLNGEVVQETTADDLIFGVAYQLADLCRTITLEPGDVILTGTPANSRPMKPGDVVAVEIDGLGRLENTIEEWDVDLSGPGEQLQVSAQTLHVALAIPEDEAERMVPRGACRDRAAPASTMSASGSADLDEAAGALGAPARARRAVAGGRSRVARLQRRALLASSSWRAASRPGFDHVAFELHAGARSTTPASISLPRAIAAEERDGALWSSDPDGRGIELAARTASLETRRSGGRSTRGRPRPSTSAARAGSGT